MTTIAFIGLGTMGRHMARHLLAAGHEVRGYDKVAPPEDIPMSPSIAEAAEGAEIAITMLPDTPDVQSVTLEPGGLAESLPRGALAIDMSTMSPVAARAIHAALTERGIGFVDAPVSGGPQGAEAAALTIMAGGDDRDFARALPLFQAMGKVITHVGGPGAGQTVKLCNQVAVALNLQSACETIALARAAGVDLAQMRTVLMGGSAGSWVLDRMGPMMIEGDTTPIFRIDLMLKDLRLVAELAASLAVPLPGVALATTQFVSAKAHGEGAMGNQAMFRTYDRMANQRQ